MHQTYVFIINSIPHLVEALFDSNSEDNIKDNDSNNHSCSNKSKNTEHKMSQAEINKVSVYLSNTYI